MLASLTITLLICPVKNTGLRARIKELSPAADYVPYAAHSINSVGVYAVSSNTTTVNYFGVVQALYVFFFLLPFLKAGNFVYKVKVKQMLFYVEVDHSQLMQTP